MFFKVLIRSLPDVREQLAGLIRQVERPLIVAQESEESFGGPFDRRQPYRHLMEHDAAVSVVLIGDDPIYGLWRDPVGELADRIFTNSRDIIEATSGYILFFPHGTAGFLRRDLWDKGNDIRALVERLKLDIPVPPPPQKKATEGRKPFKRAPGEEAGASQAEPARAAEPTPRASAPSVLNPYSVLGLQPGCDERTLRKAFRSLITQYHPDKVAHLAPEFRALAEERSRELSQAYGLVLKLLDDQGRKE